MRGWRRKKARSRGQAWQREGDRDDKDTDTHNTHIQTHTNLYRHNIYRHTHTIHTYRHKCKTHIQMYTHIHTYTGKQVHTYIDTDYKHTPTL